MKTQLFVDTFDGISNVNCLSRGHLLLYRKHFALLLTKSCKSGFGAGFPGEVHLVSLIASSAGLSAFCCLLPYDKCENIMTQDSIFKAKYVFFHRNIN